MAGTRASAKARPEAGGQISQGHRLGRTAAANRVDRDRWPRDRPDAPSLGVRVIGRGMCPPAGRQSILEDLPCRHDAGHLACDRPLRCRWARADTNHWPASLTRAAAYRPRPALGVRARLRIGNRRRNDRGPGRRPRAWIATAPSTACRQAGGATHGRPAASAVVRPPDTGRGLDWDPCQASSAIKPPSTVRRWPIGAGQLRELTGTRPSCVASWTIRVTHSIRMPCRGAASPLSGRCSVHPVAAGEGAGSTPGIVNQNRAPPPSRLPPPNVPPCARTALATVASPRPDPEPVA